MSASNPAYQSAGRRTRHVPRNEECANRQPAHKGAQRRGDSEAGRTEHMPQQAHQMTSKISSSRARGEETKEEERAHRGLCYFEKRINPTKSVAPIPTPSAINLSKVSRCPAAACE